MASVDLHKDNMHEEARTYLDPARLPFKMSRATRIAGVRGLESSGKVANLRIEIRI